MKEGIAISELHRALKDAINVTWKVVIHDLWIDLFSIIQELLEDWAGEASRIASAYRSAHLTIAASSSGNSDTIF